MTRQNGYNSPKDVWKCKARKLNITFTSAALAVRQTLVVGFFWNIGDRKQSSDSKQDYDPLRSEKWESIIKIFLLHKNNKKNGKNGQN